MFFSEFSLVGSLDNNYSEQTAAETITLAMTMVTASITIIALTMITVNKTMNALFNLNL